MRSPSTVQLAGSAGSLSSLQATAAKDPKAAIKEAAKQFEALFMQELLKSMRASAQGSGMLDNSGSAMGTEMLDQQYATQLSGRPGSLSEVIARQLQKQLGTSTDGVQAPPKVSAAPASTAAAPSSARAFVDAHEGAAEAAEAATGIPASFILGQAAHESGWGRREIKQADGSTTHNVFGIKASANWHGKVAEITTTEYIGGRAQKVTAKFRAYDSYEQAYTDYARLLKTNPRYAEVVTQSTTPQAFAQGLQKAGYATDPAYASKLGRVIDMTQRLRNA
jgi:peptidoglycan hydrolase FlgJ